MNLKGIETSFQYHLLLILLSELTLLQFATPIAGKPACIGVLFGEITTSKCLSAQNKTYVNISSANDCASRCTSHNECEYFSYCNGSCHIHRSFYDEEIKDYDCNCSSYLLLSANGT
uniref:Apple domain-containing protein n=2 Tax=Octopus bimaculoides TaxID=37653 RepID=A0A0L8HYY9_OCTBM